MLTSAKSSRLTFILWLIDWLLSLIIVLISFYLWFFEGSFIEGSATGIYWLEFVAPVYWLFLVIINIVVHMYLSYQLKIINKAKPFTKVLIWIVLIPNLLLWMLIVVTSGPVSIVHISSASANGHTYHLTKIVYSPTDDAIEKIVAFECNFAGIICHLTNPASKLSFDSNNNTVSLTPTDQPVTVKFDLRNVNQELKDLVLRGVFRG